MTTFIKKIYNQSKQYIQNTLSPTATVDATTAAGVRTNTTPSLNHAVTLIPTDVSLRQGLQTPAAAGDGDGGVAVAVAVATAAYRPVIGIVFHVVPSSPDFAAVDLLRLSLGSEAVLEIKAPDTLLLLERDAIRKEYIFWLYNYLHNLVYKLGANVFIFIRTSGIRDSADTSDVMIAKLYETLIERAIEGNLNELP